MRLINNLKFLDANAAALSSHCIPFAAICNSIPSRIICVDMAVMTHYNSSCQRHHDAWFTGMPMSSVSLEPEATVMAQWPCGAEWNAACALECFCAVYSCTHRVVGVWMLLWNNKKQHYSGAWVCILVVAAVCVCVFVLALSNPSQSQTLLWSLTVIIYNVKPQPEADWGRHEMYADRKIVGVDLYNVHLIGLCLLLAAATCVFCESARPDGSSARPLPVAGLHSSQTSCPARQ